MYKYIISILLLIFSGCTQKHTPIQVPLHYFNIHKTSFSNYTKHHYLAIPFEITTDLLKTNCIPNIITLKIYTSDYNSIKNIEFKEKKFILNSQNK